MNEFFAKQIEAARQIVAERGLAALNDPHAMIGRACGCGDCFCCAAAKVYRDAVTTSRFRARAESFTDALRAVILKKISEMSSDGTVGVSRGCLWQCIACDVSRLPGAPRGTSGAWAARQVFNSIVSNKPFNKFVYE